MDKSRPSFEQIYMRLAEMMAERSTCSRLSVGCAIVTPDFRQVLAVGYNGGAAGLKNDCDRHGEEAVGNCGCIHAEQNAVINCNAPRSQLKVVLCTHLPCVTCAKFLINLGNVQMVYYRNDYRVRDSLKWLNAARITAGHLTKDSTPAQAQLAASEATQLLMNEDD
jgi:dCMP deaminase